jgi:signal transduction histidine kinase
VRKQGLAVGSGLGLTFCRLAVEAQGGRIGLTSEVGHGTTVTLTVPRR